MKKSLITTTLVFSLLTLGFNGLYSQIIVKPYSKSSYRIASGDSSQNHLLPSTGGRKKLGFLPFFDKAKSLQEFYSSEVFNTTKQARFSTISRDSINTATALVEAISFVPKTNIFRFAMYVQLNTAELKDSSKTEKDIAMQKLVNGGGNIVLEFTRPLFYNEFYKDKSGFLLWNASINPFFDVPFLNRDVYNPGAGIQLSTDIDLRLVSELDGGKGFRLGVRGKALWNAINEKYDAKEEKDQKFKDLSVISIQPYIGLACFDIEYAFNISQSSLFDNRKQVLKVSIVPIKF